MRKHFWALQTDVKDGITPSAGIPVTSENHLIFETSKHTGVVYWKAVLMSARKAISHKRTCFFKDKLSTGGKTINTFADKFCVKHWCHAMFFSRIYSLWSQ